MSGCSCVDVEMGSYANQIEAPIPAHMDGYRKARIAASLSPTICLDRCIAAEVQDLWSKGISTTGCCCGHNLQPGFIGVVDTDIGAMKALGYQVRANEARPGADDSFIPRWSQQ